MPTLKTYLWNLYIANRTAKQSSVTHSSCFPGDIKLYYGGSVPINVRIRK